MTTTIQPRDYAAEAQKAAEDHIELVWEFHHAHEDDDQERLAELEDTEDPTVGPFCGCATCEVREILHAAMPVMAEGIVRGEVDPRDLLTDTMARELELVGAPS